MAAVLDRVFGLEGGVICGRLWRLVYRIRRLWEVVNKARSRDHSLLSVCSYLIFTPAGPITLRLEIHQCCAVLLLLGNVDMIHGGE